MGKLIHTVGRTISCLYRGLNPYYLLMIIVFLAPIPAKGQNSQLSVDDRTLLDSLLETFILDPAEKEFVEVNLLKRSVWASQHRAKQQGWLDKGSSTLYFTDGASILLAAADSARPINFLKYCQDKYSDNPLADEEDTFDRMHRNAVGISTHADLTLATWLYKLGEPQLAAKALAEGRKAFDSNTGEMIAQLKADLSWSAFADMVHAYMVRADEEAYTHGKRLLKLYSEGEDPQAVLIMQELERRKKEGTFGKPAQELPESYAGWDVAKQVTLMVKLLEEVDVRQWGQPGGISFHEDWRVQELIALGDAAIPSLIEVMENDNRLTRSVHFWRDFARSRTVIGVHEVALVAAMAILQVKAFDPAFTGDDFTSRSLSARQESILQIKQYWKKYGGIPFHERMMNIIIDPSATLDQVDEASHNLSHANTRRLYGTMVWSDGQTSRPKGPNPAIEAFNSPTAAEAILRAFDRHFKENGDLNYNYILDLAALGDSRIAPELWKRFENSTTVKARRIWAYACYENDLSKAMEDYVKEVTAGEIKLKKSRPTTSGGVSVLGRESMGEIRQIISYLTHLEMPGCEEALEAISVKGHPFYEFFEAGVRRYVFESGNYEDAPFVSHPNCLKILVPELSNLERTDESFWIEKDERSGLRYIKSQMSSGPLRPILKEDSLRTDTVPERICDIVAEDLAFNTFGLPTYSIMLSDRDVHIQNQITFLNRYKFRQATVQEADSLKGKLPYFQPLYVPDLPILEKAATKKDVENARAIFHLGGRGKSAKIDLPQFVSYSGEVSGRFDTMVLLVQAEICDDGNMIFGIISGDGMKRVDPEELTGVEL